MSVEVKQVSAPVVLGEGPHWAAGAGALLYVSIQEGTIHKYVPATGEHSKTRLDGRVGFIIPVEGTTDQFVVGLERRLVVVRWDGAEGSAAPVVRELAEVDQDTPTTRINDGKADPKGRLFAGTMGHEEPPGQFQRGQGSLYRLDARGLARVADPVHLSNGLAWDAGRRAMYYIDSLEYKIRRYDYDVDTGEMSNQTYIFDFKEQGLEGIPDGMTTDAAGNLWVAVFGGACVLQINPDSGKLLRTVPIPAKQVTSVVFGGPGLDALFVTTASMNIGGEQPPPSGATFMVTGLGVKGHPCVDFKLP